MKFDRNVNADGSGRYALLDLRKLRALGPESNDSLAGQVLEMLHREGVLNYGEVGSKNEFIPLMLKDINTKSALDAYANSCDSYDHEFANEVREMASRASENHPDCKIPD